MSLFKSLLLVCSVCISSAVFAQILDTGFFHSTTQSKFSYSFFIRFQFLYLRYAIGSISWVFFDNISITNTGTRGYFLYEMPPLEEYTAILGFTSNTQIQCCLDISMVRENSIKQCIY